MIATALLVRISVSTIVVSSKPTRMTIGPWGARVELTVSPTISFRPVALAALLSARAPAMNASTDQFTAWWDCFTLKQPVMTIENAPSRAATGISTNPVTNSTTTPIRIANAAGALCVL